MSFRFRIPILLLASAWLVAMTPSDGQAKDLGDIAVDPSELSRVTVRNASPAQLVRLGEAFQAFDEAGLEIPDLEIQFFADDGACGAEHGRFYTTEDAWRIHICPTDVDSVYEHELAHAWERADVTDAQRRAFMRMRGYTSWADRDLPWGARGIEGAASIIERGVAGLPLPPVLGNAEVSRMRAYELLTGRLAPVLVEWLKSKEVPCPKRPTTLSETVADATGTTCSVTVSSVLGNEFRR